MSSIAPAVRSCWARNSWVSWLRTSTRALPIATTSRRPLTGGRSRGALHAAERDRCRRGCGGEAVGFDGFGRGTETATLGVGAAVERGALLVRAAERLHDRARLGLVA